MHSASRVSFLAALAAFAASAGRPAAAADQTGEHVHGLNGAALPGNKAINLTIRALDAPDFSVEHYRGTVVAVNFFATWCPPCRAETPDLVAWSRELDNDVILAGVDVSEDDDTVRAFRRRFDIRYPLAMDVRSGFCHAIGLTVLPTTIFFRPSGIVSCVHTGQLSRDALQAECAYALIDAAGSSPAPAPAGRWR